MKVSTNDKTNNGFQKKAEPILTLVDDPKKHKLTKDNSVTWDLRVTPASDDSPTFKLTVRICWRYDRLKESLKTQTEEITSSNKQISLL